MNKYEKLKKHIEGENSLLPSVVESLKKLIIEFQAEVSNDKEDWHLITMCVLRTFGVKFDCDKYNGVWVITIMDAEFIEQYGIYTYECNIENWKEDFYCFNPGHEFQYDNITFTTFIDNYDRIRTNFHTVWHPDGTQYRFIIND